MMDEKEKKHDLALWSGQRGAERYPSIYQRRDHSATDNLKKGGAYEERKVLAEVLG
jgi:hypothetical protein